MKHVHVMDIRPDVITRTGVVQPYAVRDMPPLMVARHSVAAFETTARPRGPVVRNTDIQPEEFAARAKRVADATAAGARLPVGTDPKLVEAARYIRKGLPFTIKSAGRVARVQASPEQRAAKGGSRPAPALIVSDQNGRKTVVDHRGGKVSIRDHRQAGGYWSRFQR